MNSELRDRLSWWNIRAKKEKDPWIRFVLYYMIFDAFITDGSNSGNDKKKLRWFLDNQNSLKDSLGGCWGTWLLPQVRGLKGMSPIYDMRPGSSRFIQITDENNLEQIFMSIYQIRCNLFHGSKDMMNTRDADLVYFGGEFLRNSIRWWLVSMV
jgi:hypothetical protein